MPDEANSIQVLRGPDDPCISLQECLRVNCPDCAHPHLDNATVPFPAHRAMQEAIYHECILPGDNEWTTFSDSCAVALRWRLRHCATPVGRWFRSMPANTAKLELPCTCPHLHLGDGSFRAARNWNPDCAGHGLEI